MEVRLTYIAQTNEIPWFCSEFHVYHKYYYYNLYYHIKYIWMSFIIKYYYCK